MNVAFRQQLMTREQFFQWAQARDERYEFDGFQPVAMTGGNLRHNLIHLNIHAALRQRLRGTGCRPLGSEAGVATHRRCRAVSGCAGHMHADNRR
jgi:hypothetical protein